jgi:rubrerythrin
MRKLLLFAVVGLIGFTGCKEAKPVKTIEHLKEAIKGETTASAKYAAFAQKAREEGHEAIGKLFDAASKAEGIHADNHKKALEALGEKMESFKPEFEVKTTAENLKAAIDGEGYETDKMYPQFLADAKTEKVEKAIKSFNWANDTEKKHLVFYKNALEALNANTEDKLPSGYAVCPVCGNTYENGAIDEKCAFCQTDKAKYINF